MIDLIRPSNQFAVFLTRLPKVVMVVVGAGGGMILRMKNNHLSLKKKYIFGDEKVYYFAK